jgi:hypothetical protein
MGQRASKTIDNDNYQSRPTQVSGYEHYNDSSWHLLTRTFISTHPAPVDTALYFALPTNGALHWPVTGASVRKVEPVSPPQVDGAASKVFSFDGLAGIPEEFRALRDAFRRSPYWQLELERGGTYLFRFEAGRYQSPTA